MSDLPPEVSNNRSDVFGAGASTFGPDDYGSSPQGQQRDWLSPTDVPSSVNVPGQFGLGCDGQAVCRWAECGGVAGDAR
ncbi:MAG: hypothetical protein ACJ74U_06355 [Jatrophihabitantaceae bacterium]